jgi:hypothetical protein
LSVRRKSWPMTMRSPLSPDGRDLPSELGKLCGCVAEVQNDRATEGEQLAWSTMEISNALVNLNMMPIQGIPSLAHLAPQPTPSVCSTSPARPAQESTHPCPQQKSSPHCESVPSKTHHHRPAHLTSRPTFPKWPTVPALSPTSV